MPSIKEDFEELMIRIQIGREFNHASFEPIYYLIFSPNQILDIKRQTPSWIAKLKNNGWDVHTFSIAENIIDIFENTSQRKIWLLSDARDPLNWKKTTNALKNKLEQGELQKRLENKLKSLEGNKKSILLVIDLESLHPYLRIGVIESNLQGKFSVPAIFFYPGERTGKTHLKFLGFYPGDGNYRSVHVGG